MNYFTTTQLRTQTSKIVETLKRKGTISIIHRSQIIGEIKPVPPAVKPFDVEKFKQLIKDLNLPKTTYKQREKIYRKHLMEKYGKNIR